MLIKTSRRTTLLLKKKAFCVLSECDDVDKNLSSCVAKIFFFSNCIERLTPRMLRTKFPTNVSPRNAPQWNVIHLQRTKHATATVYLSYSFGPACNCSKNSTYLPECERLIQLLMQCSSRGFYFKCSLESHCFESWNISSDLCPGIPMATTPGLPVAHFFQWNSTVATLK